MNDTLDSLPAKTNQGNNGLKLSTRILISILGGSGLAALISICLPNGLFLNSWLAGSALGIPAVFGLVCAWQFGANTSGSGRTLAWMVLTAFLLRMILGVFLAMALPEWGYDQPAENAGYIYSDAYTRDMLAWKMEWQYLQVKLTPIP